MKLKDGIEQFGGFAFALQAFLIWGLSPLYWKQLHGIPAFEAVLHRMVWSFLFLVPFLCAQKKTGELVSVFRKPGTLAILTLTTLLVSSNWFIFIWSIHSGHVLQTSLGYYINPLVNVFLGMIFLKERLRPLQKVAVCLAGIGVGWLAVDYGQLPWVSLVLAFTFGFYSLIRKLVPVGPLVGLSVETLILFVPATLYIGWQAASGDGAFLHISRTMDLLLVCSALVTALPLLLFNLGAKRLNLTTIGFMQYVAPTCTFLLAVNVFGEPLDPSLVRTFVLIWIALGLVSLDSIRGFRESRA